MRFTSILNPIADLLERKNADYGSSYYKLRDQYGPVGFYVRIADKLNRIEQVDKNGAQVEESALDTLRDIIGYCTLEIDYREGNKKACHNCANLDSKDMMSPCLACENESMWKPRG